MAENKPCMDVAAKLARHLTRPDLWQSEAEPKAVTSADHGHFGGHHHSYTQG